MDGNNNIKLSGAVFELKQGNTTINLVAVDATNGIYRVALAGDTNTTTTAVSDATGHIIINGLALGTYTINEKTAPIGYSGAGSTTVTIAVAHNDYENPTYTVGSSNTLYTITSGNTVSVLNTPGSTLPTTGSFGTIGLTALGVGVVIAGILFTTRRKKTAK